MRRFKRDRLKKDPRPYGQCRTCYQAGLPFKLSKKVCADCKRGRPPEKGDQ